MNKRRIVFTDLDGTLLDHYTYQTDAAKETIVTLKFNNVDIVPNSSKTEQEILLIREQLTLESPFITENGAAVYITINYFSQQPAGTKIKNGFWVNSFCQSKDFWILLKAPSFSCVYQWRLEQEQKLASRTDIDDRSKIMSEQQVLEFIQYYQRLTEHSLISMPEHCDVVFQLDEHRQIKTTKIKNGTIDE